MYMRKTGKNLAHALKMFRKRAEYGYRLLYPGRRKNVKANYGYKKGDWRIDEQILEIILVGEKINTK
jgi:hypothetical protein